MERLDLDSASWVELHPGWLAGDAAALFQELARAVPWRQSRLWRYERWYDEPRLSAWCPADRPMPHDALAGIHRRLSAQLGRRFDGFSLAWYRDGRDSVAFHRDRDLRWCEDTLVALLVLGERRPFRLRPVSARHDHEAPAGGATHELAPGQGDLLVMGGRCQADWQHAVPKVAATGGRISLQWRWTSRRGRPEIGPGYRAPRTFTRPR